MNVLDLFKLESFLQDNAIEFLHVDYEGGMSLADAIAPSAYGVWDSYNLRGCNLVIFPSDNEEASEVNKYIVEKLGSVKWTETCLMYIANDYKFRIVVSVNDTDL